MQISFDIRTISCFRSPATVLAATRWTGICCSLPQTSIERYEHLFSEERNVTFDPNPGQRSAVLYMLLQPPYLYILTTSCSAEAKRCIGITSQGALSFFLRPVVSDAGASCISPRARARRHCAHTVSSILASLRVEQYISTQHLLAHILEPRAPKVDNTIEG